MLFFSIHFVLVFVLEVKCFQVNATITKPLIKNLKFPLEINKNCNCALSRYVLDMMHWKQRMPDMLG